MSIFKSRYFPYIIILLLYGIYAMIIIPSGFESDDNYWIGWAKYAYDNGIGHIYDSGANYFPPYLYILWLFGLLKGNYDVIGRHIWQLRYFTLFIEFLGGLMLFHLLLRLFKDQSKALLRSLFYFCNIAMFFNSVKWGQVDGIQATLSIGFFVFAYYKKLTIALIFLLLVLNFKLQAIILLPVCLLILIPIMSENFTWKNLLKWLLFPALVQALILFPFYQAGALSKIYNVLFTLVDTYPVISMNGYNIWYFFLEGNMMTIQDSTISYGLTYKHWGLLMFFISSAIILLPFALVQFFRWRQREVRTGYDIGLWFLTAGMITLVFYFFNTQMHERYSHPAVVFFACYAAVSGRWKAMLCVSLGYLVNMVSVFYMAKNDAIAINTANAAERVALVCFLCGIIFGSIDLKNEIRKYFKGNKNRLEVDIHPGQPVQLQKV